MLFQKSDRVPELQKRTETGETRSQGEAHEAFGREQGKIELIGQISQGVMRAKRSALPEIVRIPTRAKQVSVETFAFSRQFVEFWMSCVRLAKLMRPQRTSLRTAHGSSEWHPLPSIASFQGMAISSLFSPLL
jgi:hypothetical protein